MNYHDRPNYRLRSLHEFTTLRLILADMYPGEPASDYLLDEAIFRGCGVSGLEELIDPTCDNEQLLFPDIPADWSTYRLNSHASPFAKAFGKVISWRLYTKTPFEDQDRETMVLYRAALVESRMPPEVVALRHGAPKDAHHDRATHAFVAWSRRLRKLCETGPLPAPFLAQWAGFTGPFKDIPALPAEARYRAGYSWPQTVEAYLRRALDQHQAAACNFAALCTLNEAGELTPVPTRQDASAVLIGTCIGALEYVVLVRLTANGALHEELECDIGPHPFHPFHPSKGLPPALMPRGDETALPKRVHFRGPGEAQRLAKLLLRGVREVYPKTAAMPVKNAFAQACGYANFTALEREGCEGRPWCMTLLASLPGHQQAQICARIEQVLVQEVLPHAAEHPNPQDLALLRHLYPAVMPDIDARKNYGIDLAVLAAKPSA